jgi:hypothetical protein
VHILPSAVACELCTVAIAESVGAAVFVLGSVIVIAV